MKQKGQLMREKFKVAIQQLVKACDVAPDFLDSRLYFSEVQLSRGLFLQQYRHWNFYILNTQMI